jgi:hypothetical protein
MGGEIAVVAPIEIRLSDAAAAERRGYVNDADQCGSVRMPMWVSEAFISTPLAIYRSWSVATLPSQKCQ